MVTGLNECRASIEAELEVQYDAYYEELEQYANLQRQYASSGGTITPPLGPGPFPGSVELDATGTVVNAQRPMSGHFPTHNPAEYENKQDEGEKGDDDGDDMDYEDEEEDDEEEGDEEIEEDAEDENEDDWSLDFGNSLTVTIVNILAVADNLLKHDGQKFLVMMEHLAGRRESGEGVEESITTKEHKGDGDGDGDYDEVGNEVGDEVPSNDLDKKMEDRKRIFPAFAARMLEHRVLTACRERAAQERQLQLLQKPENEDREVHVRSVKMSSPESQRKEDEEWQQGLVKYAEMATRDVGQLAQERVEQAIWEKGTRKRGGEELLDHEARRKLRAVERRLAPGEDRREREAVPGTVTEEGRNEDSKRHPLLGPALQVTESYKPSSAGRTWVSPRVTKIEPSGDPPKKSFYPVNNDRPRPFLSFARFDNDPGLLDSIEDLNVPVLQNAVWRPNSDGMLQGGFGYIERAVWNNQDVAVKFLRSAQTISGKARGKKCFRRELMTWRQLAHPNILPFLGVVCVENMFLGMVSPYMRNGSAPVYIAKNPEANVLQILYDVAAGMSHLATQKPPIAHGDLKGANVLIDQDGRARICDFGLSQLMKDFQSIDTRCGGTIRWMAPEQLNSPTMLVTLSADIFSWGMLALELMTGSIPWSEVQQDNAVIFKVAIRNLRPSRPICETRCQAQLKCTCPIGDDALWALIRRCWLTDPNARPIAVELCDALAQNPALELYTSGSTSSHSHFAHPNITDSF